MNRPAHQALLYGPCLAVSAYAVMAYALLPPGAFVHPEMQATFRAHPLGIYSHVFAAALALVLGPFQFSARLRAEKPKVHRWCGRIYLLGVLIGGVSGLYMAGLAYGGLPARLGFSLLAVLWLITGLLAFRAIRAGDLRAHRRWMTRNFALTTAAVTLRLYLPIAGLLGLPFELAYPLVAWLSWIPNLIAAERLLADRNKKDAPYRGSAA